MTWTNKVIWTEGMFLQPQHLQQHDRYLLSQELQRSAAQQPYGWGFLGLTIDHAALSIGKIALNAAQGLMPDGVAFQIPGQDAAPAALDVPPDVRDELVVLALALQRPGVAESDAEGDGTGRPAAPARDARARCTRGLCDAGAVPRGRAPG
jgi:type VI secretion system protein ImpJ